MHRRRFLQLLASASAGAGVCAACPAWGRVRGPVRKLRPLVWITGQSCSGCTQSLLNQEDPGPLDLLSRAVRLAYHPMLHPVPALPGAPSGETAAWPVVRRAVEAPPAMEAGPGGAEGLDPLLELADREAGRYVLVVEGAAPLAGAGRFDLAGEAGGREVSFVELAAALAGKAWAVLAVGACAAYGGTPAARGGRTGAVGLADLLARYGVDAPVANVPGCPPHPGWMVGTLAYLLEHGPRGLQQALDSEGRPRFDYHDNVHDACPLLPDFEADRMADGFSAGGCRYNLGCAGPQAYADCPSRKWNGGLNWCVPAGVCLGCAEPVFPDGVDLDGLPPGGDEEAG
jgi:hydrogenase small subunit